MKKISLGLLITLLIVMTSCANENGNEIREINPEHNNKMQGEITFWHSFTQGPRKEFLENRAQNFMKKHPDVSIKIESFSWDNFYTKWTTGYTSGQVPDVSSALPNHVVEMIDADALIPLNDVIDNIGRDRFYDKALSEGTVDGKNYSIPIYTHAQVMWYRKDLLKEANLEVPETWDELYEAAIKLTNNTNTYGLSVPMGTDDMMATRFLNYYVRSAGDKLLKNGRANLTSPAAIDGINYWVKMYQATSPKGSINYNVLDQATLFYQGNTAFDFNSGFQISGVETNSPQLLDQIDAAPIPKVNKSDEKQGIETSNTPIVVWKNSNHPEIAKAFVESLFEKEEYIKFLHAVPAGMLPSLKDINKEPEYMDNETIQNFDHAVDVINSEVKKGTAIGMEEEPFPEAGILTNQGIIENMFQEIIVSGIPIEEAAEKAEKKLNRIFDTY